MEEKEGEISLVSDDSISEDTEMSEPPTNQDDFFVYIKNLHSHMDNEDQFRHELLNPLEKLYSSKFFETQNGFLELQLRSTLLEKDLKLLVLNSMGKFSYDDQLS